MIDGITIEQIYRKWRAVRRVKRSAFAHQEVIDYATRKHPFPIAEDRAEALLHIFETETPHNPPDEIDPDLLTDIIQRLGNT